jgi:predicted anti-sigma-YlaC factor YlaD
MALNGLAGSMAKSSVVYARDDDPKLVGDALPSLLKTVEGLLEQSPRNESLLLSACQGYASYAQAFVAVPADYREEVDLVGARQERHRAGRLFLRAREYGLRALEISHEGITKALVEDPEKALAVTRKDDVPALFWTGAAWAGAININKDDMDLVADFNVANALLQRANALDPVWNRGAAHEVLIALEAARADGYGGSIESAREHFRIAVELSKGEKAGPYVSLAESVSKKEQNYPEFKEILEKALAVDVNAAPDDRLSNTLSQERARWLLDHAEQFFIDYEETGN